MTPQEVARKMVKVSDPSGWMVRHGGERARKGEAIRYSACAAP